MRRRVVVTGTGMMTPLGQRTEQVWSKLKESASGVGEITLFDASNFPTRIAAEVRDFNLDDFFENTDRWQYCGRNTRFALAAAKCAVDDAGLEHNGVDATRFGVYLGSGEGQQDFFQFTDILGHSLEDGDVDLSKFTAGSMRKLHPQKELEQEPNMPAGHLASVFGAEGPNLNCLTACAASSQAIGEAVEMIRRGHADVMLSGGTHSMIHPFGVTGFNLLTALSQNNAAPQRASRPFDRDRDGFILGEGAGMVILEELDHARRRGAQIYGEIVGYGSSADAFRITDTHPEGRGAGAAIRGAVHDAGLSFDQIEYINAHGTSTIVNDKIETMAIKDAFGEQAYHIPVSSIKSMMGHLIAAAGAVELITCLMAIRDGVLPPTINYETPDPECDLDYVPNAAREVKITTALSNSFGFGGQNISLIVRRFDD
jgi:3-oxoacyl-[acyl-carrier-protein] synthase II